MDIFSKIYISVLTRRLTFYVNAYGILTESQAGFRKGYSTINNGFILYSIVSKNLTRKKKTVYVAFVDFQKGFDSVNRNIMYKILEKNGLSGKLLNSIKAIYKTVLASVKTNFGYTDCFEYPVGLRQGCKMSPMLFIIFINELEKASS